MHHQRKKLRLRDWLKEMIDAGLYGLRWEGDRGKQTFRVPWKHGSRHGWSVKEDAGLFQAWAVYTGKYKEGRDKPDPRKWKTNFRCALNALPDIKEIREKSCPRGKDAYKIYRMRPLKGRGKISLRTKLQLLTVTNLRYSMRVQTHKLVLNSSLYSDVLTTDMNWGNLMGSVT